MESKARLKQSLDNKSLHFKQAEPDCTDPGTARCALEDVGRICSYLVGVYLVGVFFVIKKCCYTVYKKADSITTYIRKLFKADMH